MNGNQALETTNIIYCLAFGAIIPGDPKKVLLFDQA